MLTFGSEQGEAIGPPRGRWRLLTLFNVFFFYAWVLLAD
jgi:hypothetical protein